MKIVFLAGFICALCLMSIAEAAPAEGDIVEAPEAVNPSSEELQQEAVNASSGEVAAENPDNTDRENILTCSISSWLCMAHCLADGRGRGSCTNRGVCVCQY
ncbi:defensin-A [Zeugodacus cucurbitae]|uniref:Sapecin-B n=1 Tax=Zeugodacus cucurbitae TaxID=28588 RepID=A0A0A1XKD7_ZEUCU|nr:defensin-A [Zeugodacus cucurbitae]